MPLRFMNAPLFSLGNALRVSMIALAQSGARIAALGPPMSDTRPELVVDDAPGHPERTSLDPTWIHSHECDSTVLNRLLSRLENHLLSIHPNSVRNTREIQMCTYQHPNGCLANRVNSPTWTSDPFQTPQSTRHIHHDPSTLRLFEQRHKLLDGKCRTKYIC